MIGRIVECMSANTSHMFDIVSRMSCIPAATCAPMKAERA